MGERQIRLDCDVIQADGGTRTAAITGSWVALRLAFEKLVAAGALAGVPMTDSVAAVSCGIHQGRTVLDLDYAEDGNAEADANFVITGRGGLVEVQGTAEAEPFAREKFIELLDLAELGVKTLTEMQLLALKRP
jgi:ribonuclease PH